MLERLAGGDRENGRRIAADVCAACHGEGGLSTEPAYPVLAGNPLQRFTSSFTTIGTVLGYTR